MTKVLFADRLSAQAEWRLVHRVADASMPIMTRAVQRALAALSNDTTWTRVADALKNGDANAAVYAINLEGLAQRLRGKVWPIVFNTFMRSGQVVMRRVSQGSYSANKLVKEAKPNRPASASIGMSFKETNPYAQEWAEQFAAKMITAVTHETREAARAVVSEAFRQQVTWSATTKRIRQVIGLNKRQALAIESLRIRLQAEGLAVGVVDKRVEFAAAKSLRARSELIARTEIMGASNAGQLEAWRQGRSDGIIDSGLVKEWITTNDDRLCPECEPLDGEQRQIDEAFTGGVTEPPLHPDCRCAVGLAIPKGRG